MSMGRHPDVAKTQGGVHFFLRNIVCIQYYIYLNVLICTRNTWIGSMLKVSNFKGLGKLQRGNGTRYGWHKIFHTDSPVRISD